VLHISRCLARAAWCADPLRRPQPDGAAGWFFQQRNLWNTAAGFFDLPYSALSHRHVTFILPDLVSARTRQFTWFRHSNHL